jgi:hypothetical protein
MNPETSFVPLTGRCRCEHARFRMETAPIITHSCHCRLCQRFSGTPFRTVAMIETDRLTLLEGKTTVFHGAAVTPQRASVKKWWRDAQEFEGAPSSGDASASAPACLRCQARMWIAFLEFAELAELAALALRASEGALRVDA